MAVHLPIEGSGGLPWEQGSEFHLMESTRSGKRVESPWKSDGLLFGSGRDAIKSILVFGMASMGWRRLWVPAYFCQKVAGALIQTGIDVECYYSWYPGETGEGKREFAVGREDAVLLVNHFGLKSDVKPAFDIRNAAAVIEDHTHDPWSPCAFNSGADYCIASLRKTLPVPDGGVLWSPRNRKLPDSPSLTEEHRLAAGNKLEAMELKDLFLQGKMADKSTYRTLSLSGEADLCGRDLSAVSEWTAEKLGEFPVIEWREARKRNHDVMRQALSPVKWLRVVSSSAGAGIVPFSCILLFDSPERREFVRTKLIDASIYPAILWSLEKPAVQGIPDEHKEASRRMLSIHCDMRYSTDDMELVAERIRYFGNGFQG